MNGRLRTVFHLLALHVCLAGVTACRSTAQREPLSDRAFWTVTDLAEPTGVFENADNLVSNEAHFVNLIPMIRPTGGAYIGVGPEQNFSYIVRLRPSIAFIVDIRRENRNIHFLYKALFELSEDREEFLSRLFSREEPPAADVERSVEDLFEYYGNVNPSEDLLRSTFQSAREHLVVVKGFFLSEADLQWMEQTLGIFSAEGPGIQYWTSSKRPAGPSYADLMTASDLFGLPRSYLASEESFWLVKNLQTKNLIVPVIGDSLVLTPCSASGITSGSTERSSRRSTVQT